MARPTIRTQLTNAFRSSGWQVSRTTPTTTVMKKDGLKNKLFIEKRKVRFGPIKSRAHDYSDMIDTWLGRTNK